MEVFLDCAFLKMKSGHKNKQSKYTSFGTLVDCRQLVYGVIQSECCHHSFGISTDPAHWYPFLKINGILFSFLPHYTMPGLELCASFRYYYIYIEETPHAFCFQAFLVIPLHF